jgi:predicted dehydrogenase
MAMNAAEAHRMRDAARAKPHLVAQIVPAPFTLGVDKTIRRLLDEGYLGDLVMVEIRAGGSFLDPSAPMHWRNDFDLSGFNIMTMGIWYESLLRWVGEATSVSAMGKTFVKTRKTPNGRLASVRIPEHVDVLADLACGAQLHMQISAVTGLSGGPQAWLFGTRGTILFAEGKLLGGRRGDTGLSELEIPVSEAGSWRVEQEFVNAIRGLEPISHTNFEDGVKYMEFTEAVTRSMQLGRVVPLPL